MSFEAAVDYADEIFLGKIVKAEKYENGSYTDREGNKEINWGWKYHFELERKWKGSSESKLIVYHLGTTCDYYFDIYDEKYLVYASRNAGVEGALGVTIGPNDGRPKLSTWLCSRTISKKFRLENDPFAEDVEKLENLFPNEIHLTKIQFEVKRLVFVGLGLLVALGIFLSFRLNRNK